MQDRAAAWSPDGTTIAYSSERSGFYELHAVGRDGSGDRQLTSAGADHSEHEWHPDGARLVAVRGRGNRFDLVVVDAGDGSAETVAEGGTWTSPHWTAAGDDRGRVRGPRHAARSCASVTPGAEPRTIHAPAPRAVRAAPYAALEDIVYESFDGLEIPGFLMRPRDASPERPVPAVVYPHGGPTDAYGDVWDGHAQYFVDRGYAWLASTSAARPATGATSSARTTASGAWTTRRTAWPRPTSCARSTGWTATGSASSARATAPTWRCSRSPTTPSTASAAASASTGTATS